MATKVIHHLDRARSQWLEDERQSKWKREGLGCGSVQHTHLEWGGDQTNSSPLANTKHLAWANKKKNGCRGKKKMVDKGLRW